jgi:Mor family transcriptional regulator
MNSDWLQGVTIEDLSQPYDELVNIIGIENTIKLAEHFKKQSFYFKSLDPLIRRKKEEFIINNFTGANHQELARATDYSVTWVYSTLRNRANRLGRPPEKVR